MVCWSMPAKTGSFNLASIYDNAQEMQQPLQIHVPVASFLLPVERIRTRLDICELRQESCSNQARVAWPK